MPPDPTPDEAAAFRVHAVVQLLNRAVFDATALGLEVKVEEVKPSTNPKHATSPQLKATVRRVELLPGRFQSS